MTTETMTRTQQSIYAFIGDAGAVTREEIVAFLSVDELPADLWLRTQLDAGYLYRDEFGAYSTSCPWPRVGF